MSRPRAMGNELTCLQSSWLVAQNSGENKKFNVQKTTAGIGSGCEQAQGHELWSYMLTYKLFDTSELKW
jgi:hypothetical protein